MSFNLYRRITAKHYGELVKRLDGNWHKIVEVNGIGTGTLQSNNLHVKFAEGGECWIGQNEQGWFEHPKPKPHAEVMAERDRKA